MHVLLAKSEYDSIYDTIVSKFHNYIEPYSGLDTSVHIKCVCI